MSIKNHKNHENLKIYNQDDKKNKCLEFYFRILNIIKIYLFHIRITKIKKFIEIHCRTMKIIKKNIPRQNHENHAGTTKIMKIIRIPLHIYENHEILKIALQNQNNNEN